MKTITKAELIALILSSGKSMEEFAKQSKAAVDADGCHVRIPVQTGLSVGWVGNPNYQGGKRNGYGCGLYAFVQTAKLATHTVLLKAA